MDWIQLLSIKRFGLEDYRSEKKQDRTEYQRDYDRLIFPPHSGVCKTKRRSSLAGKYFCTQPTDTQFGSFKRWSFSRRNVGRGLRKNIRTHRLISKKLPPLFLPPVWHTIWATHHLDTQVNKPYRLFFGRRRPKTANRSRRRRRPLERLYLL